MKKILLLGMVAVGNFKAAEGSRKEAHFEDSEGVTIDVAIKAVEELMIQKHPDLKAYQNTPLFEQFCWKFVALSCSNFANIDMSQKQITDFYNKFIALNNAMNRR